MYLRHFKGDNAVFEGLARRTKVGACACMYMLEPTLDIKRFILDLLKIPIAACPTPDTGLIAFQLSHL